MLHISWLQLIDHSSQFEFLRQLSADPKSTVIGLVRNKEQTVKKVAAEINRPNIHILQADLADYESLEVRSHSYR